MKLYTFLPLPLHSPRHPLLFFLALCSPFHKLFCILSSLLLVWGRGLKGVYNELSASCCLHLEDECDDNDGDFFSLFARRSMVLIFLPSWYFLESAWRPFLYIFQHVLHDVFSLLDGQYGMFLLLNACSLSLLLSLKQLLLGSNLYSPVNSHRWVAEKVSLVSSCVHTCRTSLSACACTTLCCISILWS